MKIEITFTEAVLGTMSGNPEVTEEFIASKHPKGVQPDEKRAAEDLGEAIEKTSTGFARNSKGNPVMWDYQVKGFFKSACQAMIGMECLTQEELKRVRLTKYLHKRTIDQLVFVSPRELELVLPEGREIGFCERPLRAETMRGERIALARSEELPAGTKINLEITTLNPKLDKFIKQWLNYGLLSGLGQWRNSGKGRFDWREVK